MYGDKYEVIKLWDAENYEQENPLTTDENGFYAWDVPQGQWQVKYEKDGYETEYSEWLPVPPPQLDINQGMTSAVSPEVLSAIGYESKIKVEFTKYMKVGGLNLENISLVNTKDSLLNGAVVLTNQEAGPGNSEAIYASKLNFVPEVDLAIGDTVILKIKSVVESYVNIPMDNDFQQMIIIQAEPKEIEAPVEVSLPSGGKDSIEVVVSPGYAAAGQLLKAKSGSGALASISPMEITLDSSGIAKFEVVANLSGTAYITFLLGKTELRAETKVNIGMPVPKLTMPKASIDSGVTVRAGTQVELTTSEFDSEIYYTLDGTSPATSNTRLKYSNPINLDKNTIIKAYIIKEGFINSDIATFEYNVINVYNITVTVNPDTAGTVTGAGEYYENQEVKLILTTKDGFVFKNWTIGNEIVCTDTVYTFNAIKDCNVVANFDGSLSCTILKEPANKSYNLVLTPEFIWESVENAEHYQLQISDNMDFSGILWDTLLVYPNCKLTGELVENSVYFWRVKAINQYSESAWTSAWYFTTGIKPYRPVPLFPGNSSFDIELQPKLDWENVATAQTYLVELDNDYDFLSPIVRNNINESEFQITNNLEYQTKYYWRVRAENSIGISDWSDIYNFTTKLGTGVKEVGKTESEVFIRPNPSDKDAEIILNLKNMPDIDIDLYSENGDLIKNLYSGAYKHSLKIDTRNLASGLYQLLVKMKGNVRTIQLLIVH